ncbi:PREDICTED: prostaglandin E synthase 2-like [Fragaria vesca subsp. vesca]|uniref:prostaglandin E synthase 2-like n=1 Tax=Fragaria vesca subsp. vesca TaxID=101020 RepID=UPI0002C2EA68|nr:PREDICTED: prostaglandin E synthase 2-like [Fragaria vesca subsp. vesca]
MRRINGLAFLGRTAAGLGGATRVAGATPQRLVQAATISSCSNSNPLWFSQSSGDRFGLSKPSTAAGGAIWFSTTAAQEMHSHVSGDKFAPNDVVLYQYEACPFCNKVRAFLDYKKIPYKVMEVNPMSKKEIKWSDYKKVPILKVDDEQMVDSSDIIDKLSQRINPENNVVDNEEEKKWRHWVDNHLVHVLSPNIYRTPSEALESFDYITSHGNFSLSERLVAKYGGAAAMYFVSKKLKKRHNITDARAALYGAAETWVDALKGRQFLGGSTPNLADLAVFGVLRPIRHLKSGKEMVENTRIGEWYSRMESAVGESARINA